MAVRELSDAELIVGARKGDSDAYGELYRRHADSARAAARALTRSHSDADDLTSEAFARVLRALQSGGGPEVSFRPYLVTAVRNVFYDKVRRNREEPSPDMSDEVNVALLDAANSQEDGAFAAAAFATLPERWQLVLWHTEVEGRSVAEVAPLLGLAPNAVAALAYRAREGLRQAYLQAHLRDQQVAECRECAASLGAYVRDGLSARDRRRVDAHLDDCASCTALVTELTDTNSTLRAALIPALIGVSSTAYLSGLGGKGVLAWLTRVPKKQLGAAGGTVAASAIAVAAFAGVFGGGRNEIVAPPAVTSTIVVQSEAVTGRSTPSQSSSPPTSSVPTSSVPPTSSEPVVVSPATITSTTTSTTAPRFTPAVAPPTTVRPSIPARPNPTVPATTPTPTPTTPTPTPTTPTPTPTTPTPTTPTTPTTTPATTLPPAPASLTVSAVQRSAAVLNGQFRLQITVTNNGASPVNGLQLDIPIPTGASFLRAEAAGAPVVTLVNAFAPGWSCAGNVSCTSPAIPPGQSSVVELTLAVSSSAPDRITLTPNISSPVGATVISSPITVSVGAIADLLVAETERGALRAIGNTVVTCSDRSPNCADARAGSATGSKLDHYSYAMQYVNTAGGKFNSSSAQLTLTGTSAKAYLVWAGDLDQGGSAPSPKEFDRVTFTTPSGTATVTADAWQNFDSSVSVNSGMYTAYADVTALVTASGNYSVADLQTALGVGSFGGWSLIVIDHDASLPERFMTVTAPLGVITREPTTWLTFSVAVPQPMVDATGALVAAGFEGDRGLPADQMSLSGFVVSNPFQSKILGKRDPSFENSLGTDVVEVVTSGMNGSQLTFSATSTDDRVIISLVAVALDL